MGHCLPLRCLSPTQHLKKQCIFFLNSMQFFSWLEGPWKNQLFFFVLFYLFTIDIPLFTSAQQEYTKRQFPSTETCEPLCLPPRTSINTPSQGSETNCFLLLALTCPWCASPSPPSPCSQSTRLWKYRANHLGKPSCSLRSTPSSPPPGSPIHSVIYFFNHFIHK